MANGARIAGTILKFVVVPGLGLAVGYWCVAPVLSRGNDSLAPVSTVADDITDKSISHSPQSSTKPSSESTENNDSTGSTAGSDPDPLPPVTTNSGGPEVEVEVGPAKTKVEKPRKHRKKPAPPKVDGDLAKPTEAEKTKDKPTVDPSEADGSTTGNPEDPGGGGGQTNG
jgi:hypothetical protein